MNLKVQQDVTAPWVDRLREGHFVYLAREQKFVRVNWPWNPPEPGHCAGRIGLLFDGRREQTWFVRDDGTGLDFKPLLMPVVDNLPDYPDPIHESAIRNIHRVMSQMEGLLLSLRTRIEALEDAPRNWNEY